MLPQATKPNKTEPSSSCASHSAFSNTPFPKYTFRNGSSHHCNLLPHQHIHPGAKTKKSVIKLKLQSLHSGGQSQMQHLTKTSMLTAWLVKGIIFLQTNKAYYNRKAVPLLTEAHHSRNYTINTTLASIF